MSDQSDRNADLRDRTKAYASRMIRLYGLRQLIDETNQFIGIFITSIKTVSGRENSE
jgi:hypothetical protein